MQSRNTKNSIKENDRIDALSMFLYKRFFDIFEYNIEIINVISVQWINMVFNKEI